LQLAKNADISTQSAKQYLDEKAKELNADFEVNEEGNVLYRFSLSE
jgi:trans-aconitate methyltransferase